MKTLTLKFNLDQITFETDISFERKLALISFIVDLTVVIYNS